MLICSLGAGCSMAPINSWGDASPASTSPDPKAAREGQGHCLSRAALWCHMLWLSAENPDFRTGGLKRGHVFTSEVRGLSVTRGPGVWGWWGLPCPVTSGNSFHPCDGRKGEMSSAFWGPWSPIQLPAGEGLCPE